MGQGEPAEPGLALRKNQKGQIESAKAKRDRQSSQAIWKRCPKSRGPQSKTEQGWNPSA